MAPAPSDARVCGMRNLLIATGGLVVGMVLMVVGIGFLSLVIGAVAQRFVESEVREAEAEIEAEIAATEADVLSEIRAIGERLRLLEGVVERRSSR